MKFAKALSCFWGLILAAKVGASVVILESNTLNVIGKLTKDEKVLAPIG